MNEKFENCMDLSMITDENKSHYVYIKDLCKYCLQCFSSERVLVEYKETYFKINGKQTVKLRSGLIKFKNHFKQLAVPFKIYTGFESLLKGIRSSDRNNNTAYTEKYQDDISCSFTYKVVCVDDKFSKSVVLYRGKNPINKFIKTILKEYDY